MTIASPSITLAVATSPFRRCRVSAATDGDPGAQAEVERLPFVDVALGAELLERPYLRRVSHRPPYDRIVEERDDSRPRGLRILRRHEQAGASVFHHLAEPADVRGHHRSGHQRCLERHEPEALEARR